VKNIKIAHKIIGVGKPIFIIAEAGVNHDGKLKKALELVDLAKAAGADAIKFQTFKPERLLVTNAEKPLYQKRNIPGISQYAMLKKLMLSYEDHLKIFAYCQKKKIIFLSTPYDEESADFLEKLGVAAFKLSSIEIVNHPFLALIAKKKKPVILSIGLAQKREIEEAVAIFKKNQALNRLILLHCNFDYPTAPAEANLLKIKSLAKHFPVLVGYSDHTADILAAIIAVALGAKVIEKHFTWNKQALGPDHRASIEPREFKQMVKKIRQTELLLGSEKLERSQSEEKNLLMRKSLVAKNDISKNTKITPAMITAKRPGSGLWPTFANINKIVGKKAKIKIAKDTLLKEEMFQ